MWVWVCSWSACPVALSLRVGRLMTGGLLRAVGGCHVTKAAAGQLYRCLTSPRHEQRAVLGGSHGFRTWRGRSNPVPGWLVAATIRRCLACCYVAEDSRVAWRGRRCCCMMSSVGKTKRQCLEDSHLLSLHRHLYVIITPVHQAAHYARGFEFRTNLRLP